jgi:FlaA1/EpsC-like NDP-sugar epimerase
MPNFPRFTLSVLLVDAVSVLLAFNTVAILRGISSVQNPLLTPLLVPGLLLLIALALIDGYNPRTDYLSLDYSSQHLIAVFSATIGTLLFIYVFFHSSSALQQSRLVTLLSFLLVAPSGLMGRRLLAARRATVRRDHAVVFVGDEASATIFAADCKTNHLNREIRRSWLQSGHSRPAITDVLDDIESSRIAVEAVVLRDSA